MLRSFQFPTKNVYPSFCPCQSHALSPAWCGSPQPHPQHCSVFTPSHAGLISIIRTYLPLSLPQYAYFIIVYIHSIYLSHKLEISKNIVQWRELVVFLHKISISQTQFSEKQVTQTFGINNGSRGGKFGCNIAVTKSVNKYNNTGTLAHTYIGLSEQEK